MHDYVSIMSMLCLYGHAAHKSMTGTGKMHADDLKDKVVV
jgi:hypothetical protein